MSVDQAIYALAFGAIPDVNERIIVQAFFLSKQTVPNENDNANHEYTYLRFEEFIEMIGRIAQLKYLQTEMHSEWNLTQKIKVVLDYMFVLIGDVAVDAPQLREVISESDDDY